MQTTFRKLIRLRNLCALFGLIIGSFTISQAGSVSYLYDALGRVVRASYSTGVVINYTYDAAGNRTTYVVTGVP
jgi:YD repeat-containing protein